MWFIALFGLPPIDYFAYPGLKKYLAFTPTQTLSIQLITACGTAARMMTLGDLIPTY